MWAYDSVEICELLGLFILNKFQKLKKKLNNFSLYRDDGVAVIKTMSGPESEKVNKKLQVLFKEFDLNLIIKCDKATVNYLDIILNLLDRTCKT